MYTVVFCINIDKIILLPEQNVKDMRKWTEITYNSQHTLIAMNLQADPDIYLLNFYIMHLNLVATLCGLTITAII